MSDLLIKNTLIVDGTGSAPYEGHVAVSDDKINAVASVSSQDGKDLERLEAETVIDASGLALAPGFIDSHSHLDWVLPLSGHADFLCPMVEQGFTTVVTGNCGYTPAPVDKQSCALIAKSGEIFVEEPLTYSWSGMGEFLDGLESGDGLLFNNAQLVGHGSIHIAALKNEIARPDNAEMARMTDMSREAYSAGAFGLSMGLAYSPGLFSERRELVALADAAAKENRVLTVHIKALNRVSGAYPLVPFGKPHNLIALEEILSVALETGVRLLLSHFAFVGRRTWPTLEPALEMIDKARSQGLDVRMDVYPVHAGNTYLRQVLPAWFLEDFHGNLNSGVALKRLNLELLLTRKLLGFEFSDLQLIDAHCDKWEQYNALDMAEIARLEQTTPFQSILDLAGLSDGRALLLFHKINGEPENEAVLETLLAHDLCFFETDAILTSRGLPNPAAYGAVPKILGAFARDRQILSLPEAVAKMTGRPARWIGLTGRGEIKPAGSPI